MPEIDCKRLAAHLKKIVDDWKENRETSWNNADAILIAQGKLSDVDGLKITALQKYLLGYEFSNLVFVVTQNDLFVLVSKKRADRYFGDLEAAIAASGLGLKFHMLHEKKGDNGDNFAAITQGVKGSYNGRLLGTFEKEREFFDTGKVVPPLLLHLQGNTMTYVDIRKAVAAVFAIKDDDEIFTIKKVSQLAAKMLQKVAKEEVLEIADKAKSVPHKTFGAAIDGIIENLSSKPELLGRMNADDLESSYPTMLRTGSDAGDAFKLGMENADSNISIDVALLSIGINYLNYNGCVTRTIIFHPSRYQVDCYQILVEAFNVAIEAITPGEPIKNVYNAVHKFLSKSPIPKLANYLPKSVGHSIGIERNESLRLTASNNTIITPGMVFFLTVNLEGVPNPKKSGSEGARSLNKFTFAVGDTVLVLADKDQATDLHCSTLTRGASRNASSMVYKGKDGEDEEDDTEGLDVDASLAERSSRAAATAGAAGITKERAVEDKQRQLMLQKKAEFEASKKKTSARVPTVDEITDQLRKFKNPSEFPRRARGLKVYLDLDTETVFIPINQQSVPFHISTIKSVSMSEMGNNHILRFNFHTTASSKNTLAKDATKSIVNFCNQSPDYSFIKEISIKSHSMSNLKAQFRQIKELQKNNRAMMKQALEESNLVKQDRVRTIPNPPKLQDLQMRPSLRGRGTSQGTLECHQNGFRFRSSNAGERQEFAFNNIRHAFFQPCKKELTVLIHFHLKNPIIVGKKKTVDIQFFTEVVKSSVVIHSKSRMYDPEEIDEERRERKLRKRLNDLFDTFVKKCEKLVEQLGEEHLQFDIPFREFAFEGVPFKSKSVLMPTKGALVNLTDQPVFVCSLELVEHVHLQRVSFKSQHFEMMIIWKDWNRTPTEINMVDRKNLEDIKSWLDQIPLTFTQTAEVLNAKSVMNKAREYMDAGIFWEELDEEGDYKGIGWFFLAPTEGGEGSDDESEEGSEFGEDDLESEESDEESDFDEFSDEDDEDDWDDEDESGEDWEELDRKAAQEDRKRTKKHDDYEARVQAHESSRSHKKRKRK